MASYEYNTNDQVNYGWGLTLNLTGKAPAVSKRIFETKSNMESFVSNDNDSAIPGLILSVFNDTGNNGIYFVNSTGSNSTLNKIAFLSELNSLQSTLSSDITSLQTTVGNNNSGLVYDVNNLKTTVGDNNSGLVRNVIDLQSDVSNLQSIVGDSENGLVADVIGLRVDLSDLQSDVSEAQNNISNLQSDISTLQSYVSTAQSDISSLQSDVSTLQSDLRSSQSNITNLQSTVGDSGSGLVANVSRLQSDLSNYALQSDVSDLQNDVSDLQSDNASILERISSLENSANDLDTTLSSSITVTKDVGGYTKNTVITSGTSLETILRNLLSPYVAFSYTATSSAAVGTFEYGTSKTISTITLSITQGTVAPSVLKIGNSANGNDIQVVENPVNGSITLDTAITLDGLTNKTIYLTMTDGTTTVNKTLSYNFVKHIYYGSVSSNTAPTVSTGLSHNASVDSGVTISTNSGEYIVFLSPTSKTKIQQYAIGQWNDVTTTSSQVTFTTSTGQQLTYYCYFSPQQGASSSEKYKLV